MKTAARRAVASTLMLGAGSACMSAQSRLAPRYPLNAEAIVRALHADGLEVQATQLHMPMPVSSAVESPSLEMFGLDRMPNGQVRIRLRCHEAGACVAFSVTVDRSGTAAAKVQEISTASAARERQPMQQIAVAVRPSALPGLPEPSLIPATAVTNGVPVLPSASVTQVAQLAPASVRVGAKLTLLMEEGHMHIHLPVIAIDNSTAGNEIRVTTPDHKQMFRAVVVDAVTVRGIVQ